MNRVKEIATTFAAVFAAAGAAAAIFWPVWIKPQVEAMRAEDRAANAYAFAIIATAAATRDTATLATIAKYGMPSGVPGR